MHHPPASTLTIPPRLLSLLVITISSSTITTSLLLTHFIPHRFRIHPLPYLSDAGLRDPERFILSLGIQLSTLCFLPLAACVHLQHAHPLSALSLVAGVTLAASLNTFTTVPGWWAPHHLFAGLFAGSATVWCLCYARMTRTQRTLKMALVGLIVLSFSLFGATWACIKMKLPYELIPNKDPRFVVLAIGEYIGTCAFLCFVGIVGSELRTVRLVMGLRLAKADVLAL